VSGWRQLLLPDIAPLRESRSFRLLWIGQLISLSGSQLRLVALPYQMFLLTGSSFAVGLIGGGRFALRSRTPLQRAGFRLQRAD
jgi:hypothetical protein